MSEANNVWRVDVDGHEHDIEVEHTSLTGKIEIRVDGTLIAEDRLWLQKKRLEFEVAGRPARVTVDFAYAGFAARSAFHLNGRYVEPLRN